MRTALTLLLLLCGPAAGQTPEAMSLQGAAREALERSPELAAASRRQEEAGLGEPLLLANTDPRFEGGYSFTDDRAPRAAPLFQGDHAQMEKWEAGFAQNTLLGTEARLVLRNERLLSPTPFRTLDPSVDSRLALEVRQPLLRYFWGRPDTARRRRARADVAVAQGRLRQAREEVAAAAARAFLELYFAQGQAAVKSEGAADAKKLLAKHQEKRRYGLLEASDVLQAEASLELQETELLIARSQVERARSALLAALQRPSAAEDFPLAAPAALPPDAAEEPSQAVARRGDVSAARALSESLDWSVRVELLDTLPDVALSASYASAGLDRTYRRALGDAASFDHPVRSAGITLSVPLGLRRERLSRRAARLRAEAARSEAAASENKARRELRDALESLSLARRRLEAGRRLSVLEGRKLAAEEDNFKRGRSSTDLLLRFQQDIRRSQSELLRAEVDEALARVELARASGRLLEGLGL